MSANKPKSAPAPRTTPLALLLKPQNRSLVLTAAIVVAAIGAAIYGWQRWGRSALAGSEYFVTAEQIAVTPRPTWIRADVKAEALRSMGGTRWNRHDPRLVEQLTGAFALHPWVAKVVRVDKRGAAAIQVELEYRRPVAAVEVADRGEAGLVFIDEQSVLLPSADFEPEAGKSFLRIAGATEKTASVYGIPWGSPRIAGAARLAAAWGQRWQKLELYRIDALQQPNGQWLFELKTRRGVRAIWGPPPGAESSSEISAEQKIAALEHYVSDTGPLEREGGPASVDLRELASAAAHTAAKLKAPAH